MYFRPLLLWVSGLSSWSPISMSAIPSVTSPLAGPTKCDKKSLILSIRAYKRREMWIGRLTDLFQFHSSRVRLSLGGTSRVSVYKTRQCDVTASVTGRVCSQTTVVTSASNATTDTPLPTRTALCRLTCHGQSLSYLSIHFHRAHLPESVNSKKSPPMLRPTRP
jgi:hypothetical protein